MQRVAGHPPFERGPELVAEPPLVEVGELGVAVGRHLEPPVEVEEILGAVLRARAWPPRLAKLRAVLACVYRRAWSPLHFAAWYPLHAMPSVASESMSAAAISSHRSRVDVDFAGFAELVGDVDVDVFGHGRGSYEVCPVRSAT